MNTDTKTRSAADAPAVAPSGSLPATSEQRRELAEAGPRERSILEILAAASANPDVDAAKMRELMDLRDREEARLARLAYIRALAAMKPELPVIDRKGKIEVREKTASGKRDGEIQQSTGFARWEDIDEAITPILVKHGFALSFRAGVAQDGKVTITGILSHEAGHSEETTITLPHDSSGSKNPVQAVGSSLTYGKRYAATFLLNIRTKGEDDDGAEAGADEPIGDDQIQTIMELLNRDGMDKDRFCTTIGVDSIPDIKRKNYPAVITKINEVSLQRARKAKLEGGKS